MYEHLHACVYVYETSIMCNLTCSCYFRENIYFNVMKFELDVMQFNKNVWVGFLVLRICF